MIDVIHITIHKGALLKMDCLIDYSKKICYFLEDKKCEVSDTFLRKLETILFSWDFEYGSLPGIDLEEFFIEVLSDNKTDVYHGKGKFPANYNQLLEMIGELYG